MFESFFNFTSANGDVITLEIVGAARVELLDLAQLTRRLHLY
jgi:hypothetical protein